MTRKRFLHTVVGICAGAVGAAVMSACADPGDGGDGQNVGGTSPDAAPPATKSCTKDGTTVLIGTNHNHTMTVSKEDVMQGKEKTYEIQGTSAHPHRVKVTAEMFTMLQASMSVTTTSTTDGGHSHQITISCA